MTPQRAQGILLASWGAAVGLAFLQDVVVRKDWPCPGRYIKISALYLVLGLTSEFAPGLSALLGVGFLVAFMTRQASKEVVQRGTFFGVPIR